MQASEGFIMLLFTTKIITLKLADLREQAFKPILKDSGKYFQVFPGFIRRSLAHNIYTVDLNNSK